MKLSVPRTRHREVPAAAAIVTVKNFTLLKFCRENISSQTGITYLLTI
jgi:hypothetical protein